jgi:hypothetical protein
MEVGLKKASTSPQSCATFDDCAAEETTGAQLCSRWWQLAACGQPAAASEARASALRDARRLKTLSQQGL